MDFRLCLYQFPYAGPSIQKAVRILLALGVFVGLAVIYLRMRIDFIITPIEFCEA